MRQKPARAFLGITHAPLLDVSPLAPDAAGRLKSAIGTARDLVQQWRADRVLLVAPDHYNGFGHRLMPPFCIGIEAHCIGDYGSRAGPLNVDSATALAMANYLMEHGFDPAVSRDMRVDHGFAQPLALLWGSLDTPPVLPLFINAYAQPAVPRVARCIQWGTALRGFFDGLPGRTLVIASGGLSHEPPMATLETADPAMRQRLMNGRESVSVEQEQPRMALDVRFGQKLARRDPGKKPLNPEWDRRWADAIEMCDVAFFRDVDDDDIAVQAGMAAHESKAWVVGRCALSGAPLTAPFRYHQELPELITGFGLMWLEAPRAA